MTSRLHAEITQLWAKSLANDVTAYASSEFKRLCDVADKRDAKFCFNVLHLEVGGVGQ